MNILFTVNDAFVPQLAASMCSICEHNREANDVHFYVFSDGIASHNQESITAFIGTYGQTVTFVDIQGFTELFGFSFDTTGWDEIVLARLVMARFLPQDMNRIIYLDGDTIVRDSLDNLWTFDLHGNTLGMVMEPTVDKDRLASLGLEGHPYYNAGVLLVDLARWRANAAEERILSFCQQHQGQLFANDQDAINVVLASEIAPLPATYNYANINDQYPLAFLQHLMPKYEKGIDHAAVKANPCIVHYLGEERPWRRGNTHRFKDDYHRYLAMTPWCNTQDEQGWELYFLLWRAFNGITRLFPALRYAIITSLIPYMIKFRSRARKREV